MEKNSRSSPRVGIEGAGERPMKTAFRQLGYVSRTSKRNGFSDDPRHEQLRYEFAQAAVRWSHEQAYNQYFLMGFGQMGEHIPLCTLQSKKMDLIVI